MAPNKEKSPPAAPPEPPAWLAPWARKLWIQIIYMAALSLLAGVFVGVILPVCSVVGLLYGAVTLINVKINGADPGRYIDEINLRKANVSPLQRFLVLNRSMMVLSFVLPLSRAWQFYGQLRTLFMQYMESAPELHAQRVQHVQTQFKQWKEEGGTKRIVTARPGWKRVSNKNSTYKANCFQVHVDRMIDILKIDTDARYCIVEPMVTMGQLVPVLMDMGWTLPVVPELEELTVGGMVAGTGVESSSHHSGLFQEIVLELEIVLASGNVVTCSREERTDLFEGFFWSYGTLGMLMSAKLRIIPSAKYIRLSYHPFDSEQGFVDYWRAESEKGLAVAKAGNDKGLDSKEEGGCRRFVEGLVFSQNKGVVMLGDFADTLEPDGTLYKHGEWHRPYFYRHAEEMLDKAAKQGKPVVEYWPLRDYYYRHSRSVFWEMENIVPLGDNWLFRWGFGWMLPPSVSFLKVTTPSDLQKFYDTKHVRQDMLVPAKTLEQSLKVFRDDFDMYPLWVCPMAVHPGKGLVHAKGEDITLYVDLGAYGVPGPVRRGQDYDLVHHVRKVEDFVASVDGFEMLYADAYMTRTEFGRMFDRKLYNELRQKLGADKAFPDVYDKIVEPGRLAKLKELLGEDATK